MRLSVTIRRKYVLIALGVFVILMASLIGASEHYTSQPEFCGTTCHVMKPMHNTWTHSKHNDIACVDCHYEPGEHFTMKAKFTGLGQLFSYLADPDAPVRKRVTVGDATCTAAGCHTGEDFLDKEIKYTEKVSFNHKAHEETTIEGQKLHCNTCHIKRSPEKHFEVPQEMCFLCHFRGTAFNSGRSKCALCHEIPTKPLQSQKSGDDPDDEAITHQTLEEAKVACQSCHHEVVLGKGEIKSEDCQNCHHDPAVLEKANDRKLMHERHVATLQADCFDCHQPIQHKEDEDFLDLARFECKLCHLDQHRFQKLLLVGAERDEIPETPALMNPVRTNCIGCHIAVKHEKGQLVMTGSGEACVACHKEGHDQMLEDWKQDVEQVVAEALELELEASRAIAGATGAVPESTLKEAKAMLEKGRDNLRIVEYGNAVHNKKYSMLLLDGAMNNFEDLVDFLQEETVD